MARSKRKMYVLRVKFKSGIIRRYAYGSEKVALNRMHEWLEFPYVDWVTVRAVNAEMILSEIC